jgi:hypothetical protein
MCSCMRRLDRQGELPRFVRVVQHAENMQMYTGDMLSQPFILVIGLAHQWAGRDDVSCALYRAHVNKISIEAYYSRQDGDVT